MNYSDFKRSLKDGKLHQVYLFSGPEDYLLDDCLRALTKLLDPSSMDFNYDMFYADQVDAGKIIETANAYPMLSDIRMVVVRDLHKLAPTGLEALTKYVEKPSATTRLVLISDKGSKAKAFSKLKAKSCHVEFKPLYDNQVAAWIREYLKEKGLDISYDACLLVHAHVGNNLRGLVQELDKIQLNLSGRTKIDESDVQRVVGLSRTFSVFNLNDAIGNRDLKDALTILNLMLESGESPGGILAMVTRQFVNLLKIKGCVAQRMGKEAIAAATGIPPFFIAKSRAMADKYSVAQLEKAFDLLMTTDLNLKTSQQPPRIAMQTMLLQILHQAA